MVGFTCDSRTWTTFIRIWSFTRSLSEFFARKLKAIHLLLMPFPIPPKLFPGRLSKDNRGAFDWGKQNLLAFGCQSYIVIVDPLSLDIVQTLDEHRAHVSSVKW